MKDVLVVVPGILGSRLERNGTPIWGGLGTARALAAPQSTLRLSGDGFAPEADVQAVGLIGRLAQFPGLSKIDAYDALLDGLRGSFELDDRNFVVFAYDWRLSCTVNARLLARRVGPLLKERRLAHPGAKYVFIAHSLGGLVVQQFTDVDGAAVDTREVVTLGTPFRGAAKAFGVISTGWPASLPIVRRRFRRLARTLPSVHELLPSYKAVVEGGERRRLAISDVRSRTSQRLFERARSFHDALDVSGSRPYSRTVIVGSLQRTYQFAEIDAGRVKLLRRWEHAGDVLDERGDGTVPRQSVAPPEWANDGHAVPLASSHVGLPTARTLLSNALSWGAVPNRAVSA